MRIAYDHQVFVQQRYGGISRYFAELVAHIGASGEHQIEVIAPLHQNAYLARPDVAPHVRGREIRRNRFISIRRGLRLGNRLALRWAWSGRNDDIVHETYFATRGYGRPRARVLTVYDMIHELYPARLAKAAELTALKRAAVRRADHIICISECTRRDLMRLFDVDPARTSVVLLGHSLAAAEPPDSAQATPAAAAAAPPYILYVGDRDAYKNFATVVRAMSTTPELREFRLLAFGSRPFIDEERQLLHDCGMLKRTAHETGDDRTLAARYRGARLFVCPSEYEGFGLPPLEAMAYGCPVACSSGGSVPEVVGDAGEYFTATDVAACAQAMMRVAIDEVRRTELIAAGKRRAALFSWERCAKETLAVYQRLTA